MYNFYSLVKTSPVIYDGVFNEEIEMYFKCYDDMTYDECLDLVNQYGGIDKANRHAVMSDDCPTLDHALRVVSSEHRKKCQSNAQAH